MPLVAYCPICENRYSSVLAAAMSPTAKIPQAMAKTIYAFFGIAESTGQNKSKEIRKVLGMGYMSPAWTVPSGLARNPRAWLLRVNGLAIDIRQAPVELQRLAYEKGLIPFIPAERGGADA
jgi:hypothetical protein